MDEDEFGGHNLKEVLWSALNAKEIKNRFPSNDSRGGVAILVSTALHEDDSQDMTYWFEVVGNFYHNLFKRLQYFDGVELGREPVLRFGATTEDLKEVINEAYFSSIVTIGHGRCGVWSATDDAVDWGHVAEIVNSVPEPNLKSGFWMHLTCLPKLEEEPLAYHIPFPYFAMRDANNILGLEDKRGNGGLFALEELIGVCDNMVEPVRIGRIANNSFLPKIEAWKKVSSAKEVLKAGFVDSLISIAREYNQTYSRTGDAYYKDVVNHLIGEAYIQQFK